MFENSGNHHSPLNRLSERYSSISDAQEGRMIVEGAGAFQCYFYFANYGLLWGEKGTGHR
jgi:hypothetical protein